MKTNLIRGIKKKKKKKKKNKKKLNGQLRKKVEKDGEGKRSQTGRMEKRHRKKRYYGGKEKGRDVPGVHQGLTVGEKSDDSIGWSDYSLQNKAPHRDGRDISV